MKAMIIREFGGPERFEAADIPAPAVKAGHVVVKVAASSVNTVDTMIREMGKALPLSPDLPAVLGMDFAGTITEIGEGVTHFQVGDEVYGCAGGLGELQGSLAEYMLADARLIARKPKNLTMREAAALPLVGITAYEGLTRAGVKAGQTVLVHGGAGGVGHVALQLAKHFGAIASATASNDAHLHLVESLGASGINYHNESVEEYVSKHTQGAGFDVVFDSVGGANMANSFEAAALNGQVASTVAMVDLDLSLAHFKGLSLHVVFMLIPMIHNHGRQAHHDILSTLTDIAEQGHLRPILDDTHYHLDEVGKAHARLASRKATGKVVVDHT
ncbi:zinc-dependent alcohol dehydrogenase family protein [Thaumasiovibrio subtropicus]|uniref:zinc-dependent alcohol dehydrogenase family protein n=1 Tax=Thaumasiovibrio subtropicus TaxID=1891207 RepID=UPI000B34FE99|nr:zinc-dependent alcohol dehydrogenase family protein [Thaumasiovibrio subtropicus]